MHEGLTLTRLKFLLWLLGLQNIFWQAKTRAHTSTRGLGWPIVVSVEWGWEKRWEEIFLINLPVHTAIKFKSLKTVGIHNGLTR